MLLTLRFSACKAQYTTYSGGTKKFVDYLENILIPTLNDGDVIIMDNMRSHHIKEIAETVSKANKNLTVLYLPPYSPDCTSIEMMWSKIKVMLRELRVRDIGKFPLAINQAFYCISVSDVWAGFLPSLTGIHLLDYYNI